MLHCISIIACMQGDIAHDTIICYNERGFSDYDYRGTRQETNRWYRENFYFLITMKWTASSRNECLTTSGL